MTGGSTYSISNPNELFAVGVFASVTPPFKRALISASVKALEAEAALAEELAEAFWSSCKPRVGVSKVATEL